MAGEVRPLRRAVEVEGAGEEVPRSLPEAAGEAEVVVEELPHLMVEEDAQEAAEVAEEQQT